MKIIAVGKNYADHVREMPSLLGGEQTEPMIFMKPETALLRNNNPFFLPDFSDEIHYETEIVVRICKLGKNVSEHFAPRYYDAVGVGIDFTARDLQRRLKESGAPWEISKAFDNSAAVSEFLPLEQFASVQDIDFRLDLNGRTVQRGNTRDQIFSVNRIVSYVSRFFLLKMGDIIFTGTPAGVGRVNIGDRLQAYIGDRKMMDFYVR